MNREDIRNLVIGTTQRPDKESLINDAINLALRKISAKRLWLDLLTDDQVTLLTGTSSITLATNEKRFQSARVNDGLNSYPLLIKTKRWVDFHYPNRESLAESKPKLGYVKGTTLYIVGPSDADWPIDYSYYKIHPELTDDITEIELEIAEPAIIAYTTYWTFKSLEMFDSANQWQIDFQTELADAIKIDRSNTATKLQAEPRGYEEALYPPGFQTDPFFKEM